MSGNRAEDEQARGHLALAARDYQERWGCPAAGHTPPATLDGDLAMEARHVARMTGTPVATTCPMACVEGASPWLREITRAVSLAADWHVPITDTLGRELTAVDIAALASLKSAQGDALTSDLEIERQERAAAQKTTP